MNTSEKSSIRLFENPILERLTHVHPAIPLLLWGPIVSWLILRSVWVHELSSSLILTLGLAALLVWTAIEYLMHRYVFHFSAKTRLGERLVYLFHGIHHDSPDDATRLVMPPIVSISFATAFYFLFLGFLGEVWVEPFFAFFIVGYLIYDYIHFACHHFTPRTKFGRFLKRNHMDHHFVTPDAKFGVSNPLWDWVFGTLKKASR